MGNSSSSRFDDDNAYTSYSHPPLSALDSAKALQLIPHVKSGSLELVHQRGSSSWSCTCTINAPNPVACRVALYLQAREEVGGRVDSTYSPCPVIALNYEPGMEQSFPGKFMQGIHLGSPESHMKVTNDRFPILLRVESLAPAYAANYDLNSLPPVGSGVNQYMCVHTVFAHLKLSYGAWDLQVLKEHLWVTGQPRLLPSTSDLVDFQRMMQSERRPPAQLQAANRARQQRQLQPQQQQPQQQKQKQKQKQQPQAAHLLAHQAHHPHTSHGQMGQPLGQALPLLPLSQPRNSWAPAAAATLQTPFAAGPAGLQSPFVAAPQQAVRIPGFSDVAHLA